MSSPSDKNLRPLPKPVRLETPSRSRREPPPKREPMPRRDTANIPPLPKRERPAPPLPAPPERNLRYFEQAQRSHGHKRPVQPSAKKEKKPLSRFGKGLGYICLIACAIGLLVLGIVMLTSNNALAVYLDDTRIGYLPRNRETREWDPEYIYEHAVSRRAASVAATILVNERVFLQPVRANRRYHDTITGIITKVSEGMTYQIVATAIYVHGERIAVMRTPAMAAHVANWFTGAFETDNTLESTIEGWETRILHVSEAELDSTDAAIELLDRQVETIIPYTVRDGDTQGAIALRNGIPLGRLQADNDLTNYTIIRVGQILNIRSTRPFLLVRTTEEITRTEFIPADVITNENDQLAAGDINVILEGRDGERTVTVRLTNINGEPDSEEVIRAVIVTQPETRVVEVGTSEDAPPEWR
ncbi:MAG: G5 domain-containing protein [Defluviitaleaceae bacterium]|nr:G5 domain-containing protein [Defluviitaleaceae bacterium]MCL2275314.1 G5 domain-containing protein [Defluviitaleaceae bacterium]